MLKIVIFGGTNIEAACLDAAKLAQHPLARSAAPGAWYAFTMGSDDANCVLGPCEDLAEGIRAMARDRPLDVTALLRGAIQVQCTDSEPGVSFEFNGVTVTSGAVGDDDQRSVNECAEALRQQWADKSQARRQSTYGIDDGRSLHNVSPDTAKASTPDIQVHGNPGAWECLAKASSASQGWMKSTKRMRVDGGWLYQVTTEHRSNGVVTACAEALAFVPDTVPTE